MLVVKDNRKRNVTLTHKVRVNSNHVSFPHQPLQMGLSCFHKVSVRGFRLSAKPIADKKSGNDPKTTTLTKFLALCSVHNERLQPEEVHKKRQSAEKDSGVKGSRKVSRVLG